MYSLLNFKVQLVYYVDKSGLTADPFLYDLIGAVFGVLRGT
jgi:hypothetical protein